MHDATQDRFARTADRIAALQDTRAAELETKVVRFLAPAGDERALDSGSGAGALAFALAPHVREVVAVDLVPELLAQGRRRAEGVANVEFVEGDATALSFERAWFDLAGSLRTLHHLARPELAVAELARVTRPGGRVLVVDQIAPVDILAALELDRFERARDATHTRLLSDGDIRAMLEMNNLVLLAGETVREQRELDTYLDLAGCEGEERAAAAALAPGATHEVDVGWYLARR
jgi:ubiquinone/menaquinone biosynthesis C-methylase UbiE